MRGTVRRGLLVLILVAVLGGLIHSRTQADVQTIRQALLETYLDSSIPEDITKCNLIEEAVAAEITGALMVEEISANPPVKFELVPHLYALIISSREEIREVGGDIFYGALAPEKVTEIEYRGSLGSYNYEMEPFSEAGFDEETPKYSAVVIQLGGVATNPPQITPGNLGKVVWVVAHEWGHKYLERYPLGQHYTNPEMKMLNEIVADIIAEEVTRTIVQKYSWEIPVKYEGQCHHEELRPIRITADQLLTEGAVEEAEAYMEAARLRLCTEEDWCPRELNQAFFALCERYGGGAEGDNPIPSMLKELRAQYPGLKAFLEEIRGVYSYEDFLALLEEKGIAYPEDQ